MQAQDHFMRGIFHMPHSVPRYSQLPHWDTSDARTGESSKRRSSNAQQPISPRFSTPNRPQTRASSRLTGSEPSLSASFSSSRPKLQVSPVATSLPRPDRLSGRPRISRSKTLFTIGSEVLKVAERLLPSSSPSPSHSGNSTMSPAHVRVMRQRERDCIAWAEYADGVLLQLENELSEKSAKTVSVSPSMVGAARGRCAQIIGRALLASRDVSLENISMGRGSTVRSGVEREEASYYYRKGMH